jgi:hypothetical protein
MKYLLTYRFYRDEISRNEQEEIYEKLWDEMPTGVDLLDSESYYQGKMWITRFWVSSHLNPGALGEYFESQTEQPDDIEVEEEEDNLPLPPAA